VTLIAGGGRLRLGASSKGEKFKSRLNKSINFTSGEPGKRENSQQGIIEGQLQAKCHDWIGIKNPVRGELRGEVVE